MKMRFLSILWWFLLGNNVSILQANSYNNNDDIMVMPMDSHHRRRHHYSHVWENDNGNSAVSMPPVSPDCWVNAIKAFHNMQDHSWTEQSAAICNSMTATHQKLLAFELTRCHLDDLGRPLTLSETKATTTTTTNNDMNINETCTNVTMENISFCLRNMTDIAANSYTHFFSYINQLCTRLLQEALTNQYRKVSHELAKSSQIAEERMVEIVNQQELFLKVWNQRDEQLQLLHQNISDEVNVQVMNLQSSVKQIQQDALNDQDKWIQAQKKLQNSHELELKQHQEELKNLKMLIDSTNKSAEPLLKLDKINKLLTIVITVLPTTFSCFGTMMLTWTLVRPQSIKAYRKYLYAIVIVESVFEHVMIWLAYIESPILPQSGHGEIIFLVRYITFWFCFVLYIVGFILSIIGKYYQDDDETIQDKSAIEEQLGLTRPLDYQHQQRSLTFVQPNTMNSSVTNHENVNEPNISQNPLLNHRNRALPNQFYLPSLLQVPPGTIDNGAFSPVAPSFDPPCHSYPFTARSIIEAQRLGMIHHHHHPSTSNTVPHSSSTSNTNYDLDEFTTPTNISPLQPNSLSETASKELNSHKTSRKRPLPRNDNVDDTDNTDDVDDDDLSLGPPVKKRSCHHFEPIAAHNDELFEHAKI